MINSKVEIAGQAVWVVCPLEEISARTDTATWCHGTCPWDMGKNHSVHILDR